MNVFEIANLNYSANDKKLGEMFFLAKMKARKKFNKIGQSKEIAEMGKYCPKEKAGQSWSHIKDTNKEDVSEKVSNDTED